MHKRFVVRIDLLGKGVETISGVFARAKARSMHKLFVVRTDLLGKRAQTIYEMHLSNAGNALEGLREWNRLSASFPDGKALRGRFEPIPLRVQPTSLRVEELRRLLLRVLFGRDKDGDGS